ncbi:MAG: cyanophycinase [Acidobacteriota bacterium]
MTSDATQPTRIGPEHGALLLAGGGDLDDTFWDVFFDLAGGKDSPVIVLPTALETVPEDHSGLGLVFLRNLGATDLTVLHTRDRDEADSEAFVEPLQRARAVWITGGRQWRLADSYLGTRTEQELHALLARGGVIGGTSAGATIQGSYLARGDTRTNTIMMGDHEQGFGFLKDVAVDQHVLARNRHFDLLEIVQARPELLGLGIDEDTAVLVRGDRLQVLGHSYVAITDHGTVLDNGAPFYFLGPGDELDLVTRKALRSDGTRVERVEHR